MEEKVYLLFYYTMTRAKPEGDLAGDQRCKLPCLTSERVTYNQRLQAPDLKTPPSQGPWLTCPCPLLSPCTCRSFIVLTSTYMSVPNTPPMGGSKKVNSPLT